MSSSGKSLKQSIRDGQASAVMIGSGETYFGAYGVFLHATSLQIGLLATLPPFVGAIAQGISVWLTDRVRSRRSIIVTAARIQALILITFSMSALILPQLFTGPAILIALAICYFVAANITLPPWSSLIGELVPAEQRGRFFGIRGRQISIFTLTSLIVAGQILDIFERVRVEHLGFAVVFLIAACARFISSAALSRHDDPVYKSDPEQYFSFYDFLRRAPRSNFARFVFFFASINFGVSLAGPYFALYMLRDLQLSYFEFTTVTAAMALSQFFTLRYWGSISDRFGNKRILSVCGFGVALCPILWVFSAKVWYLVLIQFYGGFVWAGFSLAAQNFIFDAVSPPKRARCAAYTAMVNSFFVLVGSVCGAYLVRYVEHKQDIFDKIIELENPLFVVFFVSGVIRFVSSWIFIPRFKEVRGIENADALLLVFRLASLRRIVSTVFGIITDQVRKSKKSDKSRKL